MSQDVVLKEQTFKTRKEATAWARDEKKKLHSLGVIRHTIKEVLNDPIVSWKVTIFTRKTKR